MNEKLIWIADDDPIFKLIFNMTIIKAKDNLKIEEFKNGRLVCQSFRDAVENRENMPYCLFMDLNMPEMNGWECLDEIRDLYDTAKVPMPKIFVISSSINKDDEKKIAHYPFTAGYLRKPISVAKFKEILGG